MTKVRNWMRGRKRSAQLGLDARKSRSMEVLGTASSSARRKDQKLCAEVSDSISRLSLQVERLERVIRDVFAVVQLLPVYPQQRTLAKCVSESGSCR